MRLHDGVTGVLIAVAGLLLGVVNPTVATAQAETARDSVLREFAADVAALQRRLELASEYREGVEARYARPDSIRVTEDETTVRAAPRDDARSIRQVDRGAVFRVLSVRGDWYEVLLGSPIEGESTGWLPLDSVAALVQYAAAVALDIPIWESIIRRAAELRKKYSENPYVHVTGFDVEVGLPPSLTVGFEFK